jgi:hypothetical protein
MGTKSEKKVDLLDLPIAERKRLCLEIRAALRERVAAGKIPVADDVIIANKRMWDSSPIKPLGVGEMDALRCALLRRQIESIGNVRKKGAFG